MNNLEEYHATVDNVKKWDSVDQISSVIQHLNDNKDQIKSIELSGNSIGYEVAQELGIHISKLGNLTNVNYRDIFTGRKKEDLPKSLQQLITALKSKSIISLDLSDNAFGPIGVASFDFYLLEGSSLKKLYVENNGLGPEGAENLAKALLASNIKLEELKISRNRLENKGGIAISKVLAQMGSLKKVQMFQNGIKQEGMIEIFKSFTSNPELEEIKLNDNSMKGSAHVFVEVLPKLVKLRVIDVSDLMIGDEFSVKIFNIFKQLPLLSEVFFNYNEIEKKSSQKAILEIVQELSSIKVLEIKGNEINGKLWKQYKNKDRFKQFQKLAVYSDEEDSIYLLTKMKMNSQMRSRII